MGKRRRAREMAIQMLYQQEVGGSSLGRIFSSFDLDEYLEDTAAAAEVPGMKVPGTEVSGIEAPAASGPQRLRRARRSFDYARSLVEGTLENRDTIDQLIRKYAENWRLERMPIIDRSILRLAIYEMLHESSVPKVVIVDEAIELAKKFGSENSSRFVNGLLDGVLQASTSPAPDGASQKAGAS